MNARFVDWVAQSWIDIQSSQKYWTWLRDEFSFPVDSLAAEYAPADAGISDFSDWYPDTLRLYVTALGLPDEQELTYWSDYDWFRRTHRYGVRQAGRPGGCAFRPRDKAIMFDLTPDDAYTCVGEYQRAPVLLVDDGDTPEVDHRFHMLIVYEAMIKYGIDQAAGEMIARGQAGKISLMAEFERRYLPEMAE